MAGVITARWAKVAATAVAALGLTATALVATAQSSNAAATGPACEARAVGIGAGGAPINVSQANAQTTPCVAASSGVSVTLAGLLSPFGPALNVSAASATTQTPSLASFFRYLSTASVAEVTLVAPVGAVQIKGISAQVAQPASCLLPATSNSVVASVQILTATGLKTYRIGSTYTNIDLGLGLHLVLNSTSVSPLGIITQRAIELVSDHPHNAKDYTVIAEAVGGCAHVS
jgi:hypothetical protein